MADPSSSKRVYTYGDEAYEDQNGSNYNYNHNSTNYNAHYQHSYRSYHAKDWRSLLWAYCRNYGPDWILLFMMAGYTLFAYVMTPLPNHVFPIGNEYNREISAYISFPKRDEYVPTWASGAIALGVNVAVALVAQFWVRSLSDFHRAWMGTVYSVVGGSVFQVTIKFLIGGLRPNFLEICKPDLSKMQHTEGYNGIYYDRSVCTGDEKEINDALQSFPSGHSMAAWAGLLFLSLYLNAKLKFMSDRRGQLWKLMLVGAPVLGATLLSLVRLLDYSHQWWDILSGTIIGVIVSVLVYRSQYCAVLDYTCNHLPLPHSPPVRYSSVYSQRTHPDPSLATLPVTSQHGAYDPLVSKSKENYIVEPV